jgi:hypothetical protein
MKCERGQEEWLHTDESDQGGMATTKGAARRKVDDAIQPCSYHNVAYPSHLSHDPLVTHRRASSPPSRALDQHVAARFHAVRIAMYVLVITSMTLDALTLP